MNNKKKNNIHKHAKTIPIRKIGKIFNITLRL